MVNPNEFTKYSLMQLDPDSLSLTEVIHLQTQLSQSLQRRFERRLALGFTDVAGSTQYFNRYGDEAGRRLVQRHLDLLNKVMPRVDGRIVDTAGDGAFTCFPTTESARRAMVELQESIMTENLLFRRDDQLVVRCGIHYGPVLTDGTVVTGDAVNLCSRVTSSANGGEIRLTRAVFNELSPANRIPCHDRKMIEMKGFSQPVEVLLLDWRNTSRFPVSVRIRETGEEFQLPDQDLICFGRLRESNGIPANDIVLELPDQQQALQISRWHFELRRNPDGYRLRSLSDQLTQLDGVAVAKGDDALLLPGMTVRLARMLTLEFKAKSRVESNPRAAATFVDMPSKNLRRS
jgi:class 3 adenylate cyclase